MSEIEPGPGVQATEIWQWRRERAIAEFREAGGMYEGDVDVLSGKFYGLGYRGETLRREVNYIRDNADAR
jgi:hypothetical protein